LSQLAENFADTKDLLQEALKFVSELKSRLMAFALEVGDKDGAIESLMIDLDKMRMQLNEKALQMGKLAKTVSFVQQEMDNVRTTLLQGNKTIKENNHEINNLRTQNGELKLGLFDVEADIDTIAEEIYNHTDSFKMTLKNTDRKIVSDLFQRGLLAGNNRSSRKYSSDANQCIKEKLRDILKNLKGITFEHLVLLDKFIIYKRIDLKNQKTFNNTN